MRKLSETYRGWLLLAFLVFVSFVLGVVLRRGDYPPYYGYAVLTILLLATYLHSYVYVFFAELAEKTSSSKMLHTGRVFSPRFHVSYATLVQAVSYFTIVIITVGIVHYFVHGAVSPWILLAALSLVLIFTAISFLPNIRVAFTVSMRKTSTEVELPFLLFYLKVLGSTHLTLYDILRIIEKSDVLRAWSSEVKNAFKFASVLGTSLITAMNVIAENHPSELVRDIFRRLLTVAVSVGSIKDIASRAFSQVYAQLEARLSGLIEKLTIINGLLMFVYLFVPIVFAVVSPLYGGDLVMSFMIPLALFFLFFFVMYAVTSSIYPSSFEITPPKLLKVLGYVCFALILLSAVFTGFLVIMAQNSQLLVITLIILPLFASAPIALYSELWLKKARLYDRFIRLALDASTVSTSLGENFITVMERLAPKYGRDVEKLVHRIILAQTTDYLGREAIKEAPSTFHAAFVELLLHSLSLGAKPEMIKELATSYEYLVNVNSKLANISRTQELIITGLATMLGWFVGFIRELMLNYMNIVQQTVVHGGWTINMPILAGFSPLVYNVVHCTSTIGLVLLSAIIGKMRGGSFVYGFRTLLLILAVFNIGLLLAGKLAPQIHS